MLPTHNAQHKNHQDQIPPTPCWGGAFYPGSRIIATAPGRVLALSLTFRVDEVTVQQDANLWLPIECNISSVDMHSGTKLPTVIRSGPKITTHTNSNDQERIDWLQTATTIHRLVTRSIFTIHQANGCGTSFSKKFLEQRATNPSQIVVLKSE
ncbi:uncharacterized protein EV154DRAFT_477234 [Mucor mucedo]|uniref:uncharacterized protein n=1 Tax=Mucor mucedo TaxID=29922 RepID=UPI00221F3A2F|nr:uncharacterized protein EV154DRAFT_477234 [Mucor mucedo]KAI7895792.1 hypothetical protein EV154DRAFT_477234 [Mucor mucedo]